ncbi:MAG TPA: nuclear transport factor 2 family protein [Chthoniobacterales bacterium]|nr:nuclear transport factor 2 family protein [Chthoniobacterales bacterium]
MSASLRAETPAEAVRAMVDAEKKFYETGQEKGTRAAFLEFLAEDGIVFRPGPVNGKEAWAKRPEAGLDLVWEPTFAVIARSADFGYDTGPAKWRATRQEEKFTGHGQFISIWKKQKDGSWKVALDCGIENPEPTGKPETLRLVVLDEPKAAGDFNEAQKSRWDVQEKFTQAAKTDSAMATLKFAADEIRVFRDGHSPSVGKEAARPLLDASAGRMTYEMLGADMSRSADLSYTYGKYSNLRRKGTEQGHYFQIWQTDKSGEWKLALDWAQPVPEKK